MGKVKIAVPSKGRLREPALKLLSSAGLDPIYGDGWDRSLMVPTFSGEASLVFVRPEDIPSLVYLGAADLGVTGLDYVLESGVSLESCLRLGFGKASIVVAVAEESGISSVRELGDNSRVATKYVNIATRYFRSQGLSPRIFKISGSAEVMPRLGAADAIVDTLSTGTTMRIHGLKPIDKVMETEAVLVSRDCGSSESIASIVEAIRGVVNARSTKMLMMNVPGDRLKEVLEVLPSMSGPAITRLESGEPMWEVITAVSVEELPRAVYEAKRRGARDIVVLSLERVIP